MSELKPPSWAKLRIGWKYVGWIPNKPFTSGPDRITEKEISFEQLCQDALHSDHGELRRIDYYPQGAVCWMKEQSGG